MTTGASVRSLHRKLATIMYEAERIPKNGIAPQAMGGYRFVQVGDAADYIRKALAEKVITMMPTAVRVINQTDRPTKAGGTMTTVDLVVDWTLTDGESGESIVIQSFGAGADGGDKYSGKASTSAMKYALLSGFLLSTGEDTEGDAPEAATTRPARAQVTQAVSPSAPATRPGIPAAVAVQREDPLAEARALFPDEPFRSDDPPFPTNQELSPAPEAPRAPHGGWTEGQLHTPGHKPLRARQNGSLFCPSKMPDGGWCPFKTSAA
jgi:ERF superfamily